MRIAHVRAHVSIVLGIAAGRRNIAIAVGARSRKVAGAVRIGLAASLLIVAGLVGAALILVVAGLAVGAGIFRVGGLDLRFGFREFVLQLDIRLVGLVLIVLRGRVAAVVFARIIAAA